MEPSLSLNHLHKDYGQKIEVNRDGTATLKMAGRYYTVIIKNKEGEKVEFTKQDEWETLTDYALDILEKKHVILPGQRPQPLGSSVIDNKGLHTPEKNYAHKNQKPQEDSLQTYLNLEAFIRDHYGDKAKVPDNTPSQSKKRQYHQKENLSPNIILPRAGKNISEGKQSSNVELSIRENELLTSSNPQKSLKKEESKHQLDQLQRELSKTRDLANQLPDSQKALADTQRMLQSAEEKLRALTIDSEKDKEELARLKLELSKKMDQASQLPEIKKDLELLKMELSKTAEIAKQLPHTKKALEESETARLSAVNELNAFILQSKKERVANQTQLEELKDKVEDLSSRLVETDKMFQDTLKERNIALKDLEKVKLEHLQENERKEGELEELQLELSKIKELANQSPVAQKVLEESEKARQSAEGQINALTNGILKLVETEPESLFDEMNPVENTLSVDELLTRLNERLKSVEIEKQDNKRVQPESEHEQREDQTKLHAQISALQSELTSLKQVEEQSDLTIQELQETKSKLTSKVNALNIANKQQQETHLKSEVQLRRDLVESDEQASKLQEQVKRLQLKLKQIEQSPSAVVSDTGEEERYKLRQTNQQLKSQLENLKATNEKLTKMLDTDKETFQEQYEKAQTQIENLTSIANAAEQDKINAIETAKAWVLNFKERMENAASTAQDEHEILNAQHEQENRTEHNKLEARITVLSKELENLQMANKKLNEMLDVDRDAFRDRYEKAQKRIEELTLLVDKYEQEKVERAKTSEKWTRKFNDTFPDINL